jgi:preprotein translocase subunit SecF
MWFLNFIPDAWLHLFVHGLVLVGVILSIVGTITKNIPFMSVYGTLIKVVGVIVFIAGVFFEGGYGVEMSWREKTEQLQSKIDSAEKQSDDLKNQLQSASVQKTVIIKQRVAENEKNIESKREIIDHDCVVPDDAWVLYNRAVTPKIPNSTR